MKIINTSWKTIFVEKTNFLMKTEKAYFIALPGVNKGIWISCKFAKYDELSKKTNKPVFSFSLNKDMEYKVFDFAFKGEDVEINKDSLQVMSGKILIENIFATLKK